MPVSTSKLSTTDIYSVSRLNREAKILMETTFPRIRVEGEISNLVCPASGHIYFTLKDDRTQVSSAMFKSRGQRLKFKPTEGMQVIVTARVSLYEPRGNFQLIVDNIEEMGDGVLQRAFEALKQRLKQEGLFASDNKQVIPAFPACIGVITSPTGAAIRDILTVLQRRFPATRVIIYPTLVQGKQAAGQIAAMIQTADQRAECDVLLLSRGGGSLEDLWPFNEEIVAHAVFSCTTPIVSAVGHEIDFVISDFVADQRCPTPSAAAELLSQDQQDWLYTLAEKNKRLQTLITQILQSYQQQLQQLQHRLQQLHPGKILQQQAQRLDEMEQRLVINMRHNLQKNQARLRENSAILHQHTPWHSICQMQQWRQELKHRLQQAMQRQLTTLQQQIATLAHTLDTVSPLATLQRGYSITLRLPERQVVTSSSQLNKGDQLETRLAIGSVQSQVTGTKK